jgi:sec-independent protein translocase protein TatA
MRLDGPELLMIFSPTDLLLVLLVFVLLFGGKKIPDLAKGLGQGIRNFKGAVKSDEDSQDEKKL